MKTWAEFQAAQHEAEEAFVRRALERHEWKLLPASAALGVAISTLQRVVERHPALVAARAAVQRHKAKAA